MDVDGPEEWHVAPAVGEDGAADPDLDLDDDELWDAPPDAGLAAGGARGGPVRRGIFGGNSTLATVVVAIAAACMGVAVGLAFLRWPGPGASAASPGGDSSAAPAASAPAAIGPPSGNGGYQQLQIIGTVTAVSPSSITIGGNGPSITGTFTGATKFTGSAAGAADIKVGDQVAATLTGSPANLTVTTIQDPAAQ